MGYPLGATTYPNFWAAIRSLLRMTFSTTGSGMIPVIMRIPITALTGDVDVVIENKMRVVDAWVINTAAGGAGDTAQVKNGATAITDAMDMNKADQVITRAGTIDDAQWDIAAGGTLRVTGASGATGVVFVSGLLVP